MSDIKTCSKCNQDKSVTEYYKRSPKAGGGLEAFCKQCKKTYYKREHRWRHLQERYNISKEEYEERYKACEGSCQICSNKQEVLCVDHCHETGEVRGLLCSPCNRALGALGDNLENINKVVRYLSK